LDATNIFVRSVGYFSHAFRRTLGVAPHKWLIEERIALSKGKPRVGRSSLSDVAAECGFSDQSHLARHFQRIVGVSPGAWRRALKEQQASGVSFAFRRLYRGRSKQRVG
jgi:AraC-like DNA-binding protein